MGLIFVYNADSGKLNTVLDMAHKILSPSTYQCGLCSLTHNVLSEKTEWIAFRQQSKTTLTFLHKDEFEKTYNTSFNYPIIVKNNNGIEPQVLLTSADISQINTTKELIDKMTTIMNKTNLS